MKINYVEKNMRRETLELVDMANVVIDDYQERGYELTLRQLYYQLVARDLIPNTEKSYKHLGTTVSNGRLAGLIDWNAIVDRTRERSKRPAWSSPDEIIRASASQYRIDKWIGQDFRVFVWVEKEALAGVVRAACARHDIQVDYVSCRGYMSQSTMWREGMNLAQVWADDQVPVILHLGDHDPSGIDMTRDNLERLSLFSGLPEGTGFIVERIALNFDQIEQYDPPPNPTKLSDSRASGYVAEYGSSSWELDALDPDVLVALIRSRVEWYIDRPTWRERVAIEDEQRALLQLVAENWDTVVGLADGE